MADCAVMEGAEYGGMSGGAPESVGGTSGSAEANGSLSDEQQNGSSTSSSPDAAAAPRPLRPRSKVASAETLPLKLLSLLLIPIRGIWCFLHVTCFFVAYFGFMLPVLWARPVWPRLYWYVEGKLYRWLQAFIGYWGYTAGYDVYEYGDEITREIAEGRVLVMANHQSTADVPAMLACLQSKGVASRKTVWLMDVMFRLTPFGVIGRMHGDYFIQQGKATRDKELIRLKKHLQHVYWERDRRWVILFPEGGFLCNRVESSQAYGRKNGFPHLEHITLPRFGAIKTILEEVGPRHDTDSSSDENRPRSSSRLKLLKDTVGAIREKKYIKETRPPIKYVLDVTIAYPNGQPLSLATMAFGTREKCDIAVDYKIYKADEVPFRDDDALRDWMYAAFQRKDQILANFYRTGEFHEGEQGTRVSFSWGKIIGMNAFWAASFIIQVYVYKWLIIQFFSLLFAPFYWFAI